MQVKWAGLEFLARARGSLEELVRQPGGAVASSSGGSAPSHHRPLSSSYFLLPPPGILCLNRVRPPPAPLGRFQSLPDRACRRRKAVERRGITIALSLLLILIASASSAQAPSLNGITIKAIRLFGIERTKEYVILRELPFRVGDPFEDAGLAEAKQRIRSLPGITFVDTRVGFAPSDSSVVVTVIVAEEPTLHGYLLTERGYENKISIGLRTVDNNFRGRSEKLEASFLLRGNTVLEGGWENPWIAGPFPLGLGFRSFYRHYRYPYEDLGPDLAGSSVTESGLALYLIARLRSAGRVSMGVGMETVEGSEPAMTLSTGRDRFFRAGLKLKVDTRKHPAFPWQGMKLKGSLGSLRGGDRSFWEAELEIDIYRTLHPHLALAWQAYAGAVLGNKIPPYRRKHLGGACSLRGFDYGTFNGNRAAFSSLELRIPANFSRELPLEDLLLGLTFTVFAEGGGAWEKGEQLAGRSLHGSFGAGAAILTKNATGIRFDYGWTAKGDSRWEIDAGIKF